MILTSIIERRKEKPAPNKRVKNGAQKQTAPPRRQLSGGLGFNIYEDRTAHTASPPARPRFNQWGLDGREVSPITSVTPIRYPRGSFLQEPSLYVTPPRRPLSTSPPPLFADYRSDSEFEEPESPTKTLVEGLADGFSFVIGPGSTKITSSFPGDKSTPVDITNEKNSGSRHRVTACSQGHHVSSYKINVLKNHDLGELLLSPGDSVSGLNSEDLDAYDDELLLEENKENIDPDMSEYKAINHVTPRRFQTDKLQHETPKKKNQRRTELKHKVSSWDFRWTGMQEALEAPREPWRAGDSF